MAHISDIAYDRLKNTHVDLNKVTLKDVVVLHRMITAHLQPTKGEKSGWIRDLAVLRYPEFGAGRIRIGVDCIDPHNPIEDRVFHMDDRIAIRILWDPKESIPAIAGVEHIDLVIAGWADFDNSRPYAKGLYDWVDYLESKYGGEE